MTSGDTMPENQVRGVWIWRLLGDDFTSTSPLIEGVPSVPGSWQHSRAQWVAQGKPGLPQIAPPVMLVSEFNLRSHRQFWTDSRMVLQEARLGCEAIREMSD